MINSIISYYRVQVNSQFKDHLSFGFRIIDDINEKIGMQSSLYQRPQYHREIKIAFGRCRLQMGNYVQSTTPNNPGNLWVIKSSDGQVDLYMYIGPNGPSSTPLITDLYGSAWAK
jgi:hypothetical protein